MIAFLIAWALIGVVFFAGIAAEHRGWDRRDFLQVVPALLMVMVMWPAGLAYWSVVGRRINAAREGRRHG